MPEQWSSIVIIYFDYWDVQHIQGHKKEAGVRTQNVNTNSKCCQVFFVMQICWIQFN